MFADDFAGLAGSAAQLQAGITAARAWCDRWRMQANVGPGKSAVMLFAPEAAARPLLDGDLLWGDEPLPVVSTYKYLGVMLAATCRWDDHVAYVVDKATRRAFTLGGVLHNRRMATAVRRVVLLAVVRPVVEHASTVWCTTAAQQARLEQVQTRVLRRIVGLPCAVADDVLRMELGCRPYASWMDQRKLEFAFRLAAMAADRLPARVASAGWPSRARKGAPALHSGVVAALERAVDFKVADLAGAGVTAAAFKKTAGEAVRARDVRAMQRRAKSTVSHHLLVLGSPAQHTNQLQQYLSGPLTESQRLKFICRAGVMRTARRRWQQGRAPSPQCPMCPGGQEETMQHALLACSAFAAERAAMWASIEREVGLPAATAARGLPADRQLAALLGDAQWGDRALAVDGIVRGYLEAQFRRRQQVTPVAAGGAACDPADVACQVCHSRGGAATMLLCDGCDRGYHTRCLVPALPGVPAGDWMCPGCAADGGPGPLQPPQPPCPRLARASYDDVACQVCAGQHGEASMLLCDGCDRGFHMGCVGVRGRRPPPGAWYCSGCTRVPVTTAGRRGRGARAHGARA
jgi:hypothetical protein